MPAVVIVSAGKGLRMNAEVKKQYLSFYGKPLIVHTVLRFLDASVGMDAIVLVAPEEDLDYCRNEILETIDSNQKIELVSGGDSRQASVFNGLLSAEKYMRSKKDIVLIHDGVRPFITRELIVSVTKKAEETGGAIPGVPSTDTLKKVKGGTVLSTIDRSQIYMAQTPQAFQYELIRKAHESARSNGIVATDDASLFEALSLPVSIVPGNRKNIKITTPTDMFFANALLENIDGSD